MTETDVLRRLTTLLERAEISYMLSGSFASAYYGTSRSTQDIDFVIEATPDQLKAFIRDLNPNEYYADLIAA